MGIISIKRLMLAGHSGWQNLGPLPGRQGLQPFDAQGDPVLLVGDQGQVNDGPQQQAQASGKFEAMQVGDGTGVHPCKAAADDDHMRRTM